MRVKRDYGVEIAISHYPQPARRKWGVGGVRSPGVIDTRRLSRLFEQTDTRGASESASIRLLRRPESSLCLRILVHDAALSPPMPSIDRGSMAIVALVEC